MQIKIVRLCLIPVLLVLSTIIIGASADCWDELLTNASSQIISNDGRTLQTTNWTNDQSFHLKCNEIGKVWSNGVRVVKGVSADMIDTYDSSTKLQLGTVSVTCSDGQFVPNIFSGITVWCTAGCSPIQADDSNYWNVTYSSDSLTTQLTDPPILEGENIAKISCINGYVGKSGEERNVTVSSCKNGQWENMVDLITCVPGCGDITQASGARTTATKKRSDGYAPFVAGDSVSFVCENGGLMVGNSTVTCNSLNQWYPDLPVCSGTIKPTSILILIVTILVEIQG